jgi:hypothetical protein
MPMGQLYLCFIFSVSRHCLAAISVVKLNDNEYPLDASL